MSDPLAGLRALAENADEWASASIGRGDARAILALVDDLRTGLSDAERLNAQHARGAEGLAAREDVARRNFADAQQIRASSDAVRHNADVRVNKMWRELQDVRAMLVNTLAICDIADTATGDQLGSMLSDEQRKQWDAAKDAMKVVDWKPPE